MPSSDGSIKIRIGAMADRSVDTVFGTIEKRAQQARDRINKLFGAGAGGAAGSKQLQGVVAEAEKANRAVLKGAEKAAAERTKAEEKAARERIRTEERANREIVRAFQRSSAELERETRKRNREIERDAIRERRVRERFAERTSYRATRFLFPPPEGIIGAGRRMASDLLRGAGVDMSLQGSVSRAVGLQTQAVQLANQERIATGTTRGFGYYENLARTVGDKVSTDPGNALRLASTFTARTGDFERVGELAPQLASLATASGATNLEEIGNAAGMVYNQLKLLPDAGNRTIAVMRGIVGQTAVGAVEMEDYAVQLGRVAANAFRFEGPTDENILKLSALTQLSMERGATSAADASRGTAAFTNTFGKTARIKAFNKEGVDLFTDKSQTMMRDPFEIIKDSFRATNGNIPTLANMYADTLGRKSINSLGAVYQSAGGGEAGIKAVDDALRHYMDTQLTAATEQQNLADLAKSNAAKAQRFQNNLDRIAASMADKVLPALEELAPVALNAAKVFGGVVEFAAKFPAAALAVAASAAILRAALESAARAALERALVRPPAGGLLPGAPTPTVPGATGAAGGFAMNAFRVGAAGLGGALAGGAIGEMVGDGQAGAYIGGGIGAGAQIGGPLGAVAGASVGVLADQVHSLIREGGGWDFWNADDNLNKQARDRARVEGRKFDESAPRARLPDGNSRALTPDEYDRSVAAAKAKGLFDPNEVGAAVANGMVSKTLNVRLMNPGDIKLDSLPKVSSAGRAPPPGSLAR